MWPRPRWPLSSLSFAEIARPHMEQLVHELDESSSVSVLDDTDIVYVMRVPTRRIMTITLAVGARLPAFATSMGRILLAALPAEQLEGRLAQIELHKYTQHTITSKQALREDLQRVAHDGFAIVDQELEEGLRSVAVPIRDAAGSVAALNISVHASRTDMRTLCTRFVPEVLRTAAAIEHDIRGAGGSIG